MRAADGTAARIVHDYVESATSDGTAGQPVTVTYKHNPRAIWNSGRQIDATDWIRNWEVLNGKDPAYSVVSTAGNDSCTVSFPSIVVSSPRPLAKAPARPTTKSTHTISIFFIQNSLNAAASIIN